MSIAYSKALAKINILNSKEQKNIEKALKNIFKEIKYNGTSCFYFTVTITNIEEKIIYLFPESNLISSLYF